MEKNSKILAYEDLEINQLSCMYKESCCITKMKHHSLFTVLNYPVRYGKL